MASVTALFLVFRNVKSAQVVLSGWTTDVSGCPVVSGIKSGLKDEVHRSELSLATLEKSWEVRVSYLQWLDKQLRESGELPLWETEFNIK